ncbi:MAG: glycogen/starch synthase [Paludibacteraceae bacterium]|nr:glycogen/starch synthase [Paludibacteraceae bacterium]
MQPEYIFETSWEVCQKIGGIYAVLSTRAAIMQKEHKDKVFFIGPDLNKDNRYFKETHSLLADWQKQAAQEGLKVRVGRWLVPGKPIAILVDFNNFYKDKNRIYFHNWERFSVNSIAAYGDYDESSVFGYATGVVMESIYRFYHMENTAVVAHFNEWMTSFGLFYVKEHMPKVGTLFTTHATSIGRSIAGNGKPLYDYFSGYDGDQMAQELNMVSKHSTEKQAAINADCFTTVSEITNKECRQLLRKPADVVTPNGFESEFVPKTETSLRAKRAQARQCLRHAAEQVLGYQLDNNALFVAISGRYEWKNKGIDIFIESLKKLQQDGVSKQVVAFIMVPAWISENNSQQESPSNVTTHQLREPQNDPVLNTMLWLGMQNKEEDRVKVVFIPSYLKGDDGVLNMTYYDLLTGLDLTVFPSYYEPWGYTPLESIAFHVPTVTTSLAGFGQWARENRSMNRRETDPLLFGLSREKTEIESGVAVVERTDSNRDQVINNIAHIIADYASLDEAERAEARRAAAQLAEKAEWSHFFEYYRLAYSFALRNKN